MLTLESHDGDILHLAPAASLPAVCEMLISVSGSAVKFVFIIIAAQSDDGARGWGTLLLSFDQIFQSAFSRVVAVGFQEMINSSMWSAEPPADRVLIKAIRSVILMDNNSFLLLPNVGYTWVHLFCLSMSVSFSLRFPIMQLRSSNMMHLGSHDWVTITHMYVCRKWEG